jgi:hypothetical protein
MPLRGDKIGAILAARSSDNAIPTYRRGTAEWQSLGGEQPQPSPARLVG